ncbi:MAG: hypothetical protein F7C38_04880 [Desulfurococcales archaeon]|nr:hypothetical protein [Desulfurococcales archaeon]
MQSTALLVSGTDLVKIELASKLILGVLALLWISVIIGVKVRRIGRAKRILAILFAVIATLTVMGGLIYIFRPGTQYGVWIEDDEVLVRFYADGTVAYNICDSNITLLPVDSVDKLLSIRTNGIADPSTGLYAGYFKASNGLEAYVLVHKAATDHVLAISNGDTMALIGLKGVEDIYRELALVQDNSCR